jgi:hypothetical protein
MKLGVVIGLLYFILIVGWGMNIYKFCKLDFKEPYKAEIVRGIGIPTGPVGAIMGFMTIEDGNNVK